MSETGESPQDNPPSQPALQFETAEGRLPGQASCAGCGAALATEYHELNGHAVCAVCRAKEEAVFQQDQQWSRFVTAAVYGFGAAIAGGLLYWGFVKITNIEFGLMAIAVGWLVGKAVMKGSNMRGGRRYQYLALAMTYFSITMSYGALMIEQMVKHPPSSPVANDVKSKDAAAKDGEAGKAQADAAARPGAAALALGLAMLLLIVFASPFLAGFSNIIGWVIIAIGLFEAWKQTRALPFSTGGPFPLGTTGGASPLTAQPAPAE